MGLYQRDYGKYGKMDFSKLWDLMEKRNINKQWLVNRGLQKTTIYKLARNENVTCEVLTHLCYLMKCQPKQIMDYIPPSEE